MSAGTCSRCGRQAQVEYGSDGLAYCSSCSFYGLNKQCWRCRMYLPAAEMQQYRGQWTCPICIQDMRSESSRSEYKPEKHVAQPISVPETCERCGRDVALLYYWNGRNLCKSCLEDEQSSWGLVGGGPGGAGQAMSMQPIRVAAEESFFEKLVNSFLALLGIRRRKKMKTIVAVHEHAHMPIDRAKPMTEGRMSRGGKKDKEQRAPQSEGLMTKREKAPSKKGKAKAKKGVSFPEYKEEEGEKPKGKKKKPDEDNPFRNYKKK